MAYFQCMNIGGGGNEVVANPQGSPTETLSTIQIGATVYEIPSGGRGITNSTVTPHTSSNIQTTVTVTKEE